MYGITVMTRNDRLRTLRVNSPFDVLVIGGGATGCGIALDAASRGLKTALIERADFAEGSSSRSTKLVHGGVRYLEMAIRQFDRVQFNLVKDGLRERATLIQNARHLAHRIPLVTPIYRWIDVPYLFIGLKLYDLLAGKRGLGPSRLISRNEALRRFPMLKGEGLKAGVVYFDGQLNDARMALTLAMTAQSHGACVVNHVEALQLIKDEGKITGAEVKDRISGETFEVHARCVINATGPFGDSIRKMDDAQAAPLLKTSSGIHIVLDSRFAPPATGLTIPKTEDGRVLFILPWQGRALIGTTDEPSAISPHPKPTEEEIAYLLRHIGGYFDLEVKREDIQSVWSGLRPLVSDPQAADTARLARDHIIEVSRAGLLTITGGKWTTYRKMASDAVDHAIEQFSLRPKSACKTANLPLIGSQTFDENAQEALQKEFGLDPDVAWRLHQAYGDQARRVAQLSTQGYGKRLHPNYPILEAEVIYAARQELAERAQDVLARRTSLAMLDCGAAKVATPRVIELMASQLGWDQARQDEELSLTLKRWDEAI